MTYFYDFVHLRICVSVSIRVGLSFDFMIIKYSFNIIHLHVCIYFSFDKNILTSSIKKHCYFSGDNIFLWFRPFTDVYVSVKIRIQLRFHKQYFFLFCPFTDLLCFSFDKNILTISGRQSILTTLPIYRSACFSFHNNILTILWAIWTFLQFCPFTDLYTLFTIFDSVNHEQRGSRFLSGSKFLFFDARSMETAMVTTERQWHKRVSNIQSRCQDQFPRSQHKSWLTQGMHSVVDPWMPATHFPGRTVSRVCHCNLSCR